ncbi:DUF4291 domain-containing protein [Mucilaginibacter ginsenosidivorax]|uniref:DUF4291 domain-containing protein n=1 Tax=Mucilaginibacter ginsenosidivorax TaxID=862126 RepID=UPI001CEF7281|nr:DUF4291 domain-containing protein [Mucilaginibacter ginsenosidivorax]
MNTNLIKNNPLHIITELYQDSIQRLPKTGQHLLGHQTEDLIIVYQAYNHNIADFAVENQFLGGNHYSYSRMSWIKPNFLWMMYRCGWAEKENQERVLALWIQKTDLEKILGEAAISSFNPKYYESHAQWRAGLDQKEVRLQWDPDHDPYGNKLQRRAIQLGLKGKMLEAFGKRQIRKIEDVTNFVKLQKQLLDAGRLDELLVPFETAFKTTDAALNDRVGIEG